MIFFYLFSIFFFVLGLLLFGIQVLWKRKNILELEQEKKENPSIAILIPAREESKVIEGLLTSIEGQTIKIPSENIFVIVEDEKDKTVDIVKKKNMSYFVRKKLHLKTKGYALAEMVEDLKEKEKFFDCYFIFDADNILAPDFLERMLEDYNQGYAISTGYRALKNPEHTFPFCAGLTFSIINEFKNKSSIRHHGNLILSGTGYYIHGRLIKEWGTFPFHSLTEDYESSLYYTLHGISTHYKEDAIFFDEQPENLRKSILQRSRWIKGYFKNWLSYQKKFKEKIKEKPKNLGSLVDQKIGISPLLCFLIGLVFLFGIFLQDFKIEHLIFLFFGIGIFYFFLVLLTAILIFLVTRKTIVSKKVILLSLFYHPIFLLSYIPAFLKSLSKNTGWDKISHG